MKPSAEILALAEALIEQLGADDRRDLLSRWMAHDLAAKLVAADAPGADAEAQAACTEAVRALWARRAELPTGKRPFEDLEELAEAVRRLDPERTPFAYFRRADAAGEGADPWLDAAERFDRGARVLILTCLKEAAVRSGRKAGQWAELAEGAGLDAREIAFVRIMRGEEEPDVAKRREADRLRDHLQTLTAFRKAATAVATEFRGQLAALEPLPPRKRSRRPVRLKSVPPSPRR